MGRINLHCWQRCYDKAHVWSPRLTSLGKIWSNQIFWSLRLLITKPWFCSMDFVPSNFPTNPSWFKSFATNRRNTHGPSTPPSPLDYLWRVKHQRSTPDMRPNHPHWQNMSFFGMDMSQRIITRMHSQQWYSVPISDIIHRYIICIHM